MSSISIPEYRIFAYFAHRRLLLSLIDLRRARAIEERITSINIEEDGSFMREWVIEKEMTNIALEVIKTNSVPPLEEVLLTGKLAIGQLVTVHRPFYFKGASLALLKQESTGKKAYAEFHGRIKEFDNLYVTGKFSPEHFTYSSTTDRLSGHRTRFMLAIIDTKKPKSLELRPILIGDRIYGSYADAESNAPKNAHRIFPEDISEFAQLAPISKKKWDLKRLRDIPERQVKEWFAKLIAEGNVPKDWGGETSDLFSTHLHLNGRRASCAFLLKGPAKFHPLTLRDLGINGDQIVRLFHEPADIHIVQHCHYIRAEILHHLDAFASRPNNASLYCVIDGIDTLRIFTGYGYL